MNRTVSLLSFSSEAEHAGGGGSLGSRVLGGSPLECGGFREPGGTSGGRGGASRHPASRLPALDLLRGLNLLSMIAYHGAYDLVYLYGVDIPGYRGLPGYLWQQSICWIFIFLSGFCFCLGRFDGARRIRRGLLLSACGLLITAVTALIMPESLILMGVLSFFGLAVLLTVPLYPLLVRIPAYAGLAGCLLLFFLTRDVSSGWLGFEGLRLLALPDFLYHGVFPMILGFPWPGFFSTDYFALLPWIFLFWSGFFTFRCFCGKKERRPVENVPEAVPEDGKAAPEPAVLFLRAGGRSLCAPLEYIGRHTLPIYMIHQPALMAVFLLLQAAGIL